jgi:PAS domain S-box-containing protein
MEAERALREREERLSGIMDNAADGIIVIDERGIIENLNRSSENIFGYLEEEVCGQNISMLMPDPDRSQHDDYIANYLKAGKAKIIGVSPREVLALRKDGSTFPMNLAVSVIEIDGKKKFIGITRDITIQKEVELQLQQSQKMETVGQLTSSIAHDFNNLLTVIIGNLQILHRSINGNETAVKRLDTIMGAAKGGAELIRRLLSFSRQQVLQTRILDLNEVVRGVEEMLSRTMGENVAFTLALDNEPCLGRTDRSQFEHAVLNLCLNARDAMPEGGHLTIKTRLRRLDNAYVATHTDVQPGNYIEVSVTDTGTGIPDEIREKLFEPFFTTKEQGKGTGLGLSTVIGFMKQTGGYVDVDSVVGHGTTFSLFVPIAGSTRPTIVKRRLATSVPLNQSEGGSILIVEDEDAVREIAVSVLMEAGYNVVEANSGLSGLKAFNDNPGIHAVFSDVILPGGMNGPEMIDAIRKTRPEISVLFASGYTEQAQDDRVASLERAKFITKPYDVFELPHHIALLLDAREN